MFGVMSEINTTVAECIHVYTHPKKNNKRMQFILSRYLMIH